MFMEEYVWPENENGEIKRKAFCPTRRRSIAQIALKQAFLADLKKFVKSPLWWGVSATKHPCKV